MKLLDWLLGRKRTRESALVWPAAVEWAQCHFPPNQRAISSLASQIICEQLGVTLGQLAPTTRFIEDLGADSLDFVELVMAFEEEFQVDFPDQELENLKRIGDLVAYLNHRLAEH